MRNLFRCFCPAAVLTVLLFAFSALGLDVPPLTGRVVDQTGILNSAGIAKVDEAIRELEKATGGQMAVLIVPTLKGQPIEEFGIAVMDKWKIGHKGKDDGAILIVALNDRKLRLEVGYGWEGPINDARVGDIIRSMGDYFRKKQYADGVVHAVGAVQKFVSGKAPKNDKEPEEKKDGVFDGNFSLFPFLFIVIVIVLISRGGRRGGRGNGGGGFFFGGGGGGGFGGGSGGGGFSGGGGSGGGGGASGGW